MPEKIDYKKALVSLKAYLPNDNEIAQIIELCNLVPVTDSWKLWTDGSGHLLILSRNKKAITKKILNNNLIIKDLYHKSAPKHIAKNSKWAMISIAKNKENNISNICYIWFIGNDNKLRLQCYLKNEWVENQMPLGCGLKTLRTIVKNLNLERYKVIMGSKNVKGTYSGKVEKTWITNWPPQKSLQLDMLLTSRNFMHKILIDCGVLVTKEEV